MKTFSPVKKSSKIVQAEILNELRTITERQGTGLQRDSFLSLTNDREDQFFLKSAQNFILWSRVFFEPFTLQRAEQLKIEQEDMKLKFLQPLKLQVFFNEGQIDPSHSRNYPDADYYYYSMIQSSAEKAMIVERISLLKEPLAVAPPLFSAQAAKRPAGYNFSRQSQLTRNELTELIDLSLDLKRS